MCLGRLSLSTAAFVKDTKHNNEKTFSCPQPDKTIKSNDKILDKSYMDASSRPGNRSNNQPEGMSNPIIIEQTKEFPEFELAAEMETSGN